MSLWVCLLYALLRNDLPLTRIPHTARLTPHVILTPLRDSETRHCTPASVALAISNAIGWNDEARSNESHHTCTSRR